MRWFGFGFNAFGQICLSEKPIKEGDVEKEVKVIPPAELSSHVDRSGCCLKTSRIRASWSRRASLHLDGSGCVCLAGFRAGVSSESCGFSKEESRGCKDAHISESYLILSFPDRIESWDLEKEDENPLWVMEIKPDVESSGPKPLDPGSSFGNTFRGTKSHERFLVLGKIPFCSKGPSLNLPLVSGGYIAPKPPFYHSLSPHLKAKSLALGAEHAVLLSSNGAVYTWGLGSHGQLGHGGLTSEEEPRAVEALWGMSMSSVATGGWHSVCVSDGGDLYVWGWNESGQLGLPSRGLRKALQQQSSQQAVGQDASTSPGEEPQQGDEREEVFISIQAFPALLDVTPSCEVRTVSCGSRHTAAVTTSGDLYTWGWGEYGQLGHQTLISSDEPQCVKFFRDQQMRVVDVVCGAWNTFAAVIKEEVVC